MVEKPRAWGRLEDSSSMEGSWKHNPTSGRLKGWVTLGRSLSKEHKIE